MARARLIHIGTTVEEWFGGSPAGDLEDFPMACQDLDHCGVIRRINSAFSELLGYDATTVLGRHVWDLILPEEVDRARRGYAQKLCGERYLLPFDRSYVHANGGILTLQVHDMLVLDPDGDAVGIRSGLVDVTERRQREKDLCSQAAFAEALMGALPDGIIVADVLGTVTSMNAAAEILTGKSECQSLGRPIEEVVGPSCPTMERDNIGDTGATGSLVAALLSARNGVLRLSSKAPSNLSHVTLSSIVDSGKGVIGILVVLR